MQFDEFETDPQEDATAARKQRIEEEAADLRKIAVSLEGQRFLIRVFEETGLYRTSFDADPTVAALNEGRKTLGYWLVAELVEHAPEAYFTMLRNYASTR